MIARIVKFVKFEQFSLLSSVVREQLLELGEFFELFLQFVFPSIMLSCFLKYVKPTKKVFFSIRHSSILFNF
jgi:hypothetical protein